MKINILKLCFTKLSLHGELKVGVKVGPELNTQGKGQISSTGRVLNHTPRVAIRITDTGSNPFNNWEYFVLIPFGIQINMKLDVLLRTSVFIVTALSIYLCYS